MDIIYTIIFVSLFGPIIGSLIGVMKRPSERWMYNLLSFAAGIMLGVSFLQLIPVGIEQSSSIVCILGVMVGTIVMFFVDKLTPHLHPAFCRQSTGHHLKRTALYVLVGIFIHNFPEGMAMGLGAVVDLQLSLSIALAIALHDIPEGICTSAPYYSISRKRLKAFLLSASTGIPTLIGFLTTYYLFNNISQVFIGFLLSATAGIMIYISSDELIPASCCKLSGHSTIFSLILGVISVVLLDSI